jgi:hypothetical protein
MVFIQLVILDKRGLNMYYCKQMLMKDKRLNLEIIKSYKNHIWYFLPTIRYNYVKCFKTHIISILFLNIDIHLELDLYDKK